MKKTNIKVKCSQCKTVKEVDIYEVMKEKRLALEKLLFGPISGYAIAKKTGVSEGYISTIKSKKKIPKFETVIDILEKWYN